VCGCEGVDGGATLSSKQTAHPPNSACTGACVNIDACTAAPCGSPFSDCTDLPPPFPANASGRVCRCRTPLTGNGDTCDCGGGYSVTSSGTCADANACTAVPCSSSHAQCTDLLPPASGNTSDGRRCQCIPPFVGECDNAFVSSLLTRVHRRTSERASERMHACTHAHLRALPPAHPPL
jgi:hypothetical protein